jgi:hypothetical protein
MNEKHSSTKSSTFGGSLKSNTKSFTFDMVAKFSLEKEIDELAKLASDGKLLDWKSAIVVASAYLEMLGRDILLQKDTPEELKKHLKNMGVKISEKTEKRKENTMRWFDLYKANLLLQGYRVITPEQFAAIDTIRDERNNIVHKLKSEKATETYNPRLNAEANEKYGKMVNNAKKLIGSLENLAKSARSV